MPVDIEPSWAFWRSPSSCSVLNSNWVPVRLTGLSACALARASASFISSSSMDRLYTCQNDAIDLSLARRSVFSLKPVVGASAVVPVAGVAAGGASRAASLGRVEALFTLSFSHFDVRSQRSSSTISSESLSFAEDVVPFSGFHFTSLYTSRPEPVNHLEASSPKRCRSAGIVFTRKR
jgi:hypothetical protein